MEARAVLEVLRIVHPKARLIVLTDCEELVKAYRSGLSGERVPERWVRPINKLVKASRGREVTLQWVKGHERCIPNRIADRLAYHAMSYTREGQRLDFFRLARIVHQVETRLEATLREEQAAA
jgi:ribonuclease HI